MVISSHHSLFFNVVCNELKKEKHKKYFLHRPNRGGEYTLRATNDTPFFHHVALLSEVRRLYPQKLAERYKLTPEQMEKDRYELLEQIGKNRGMRIAGGEIDLERAAVTVVDEFRASKLGSLSLEEPDAPETAQEQSQ